MGSDPGRGYPVFNLMGSSEGIALRLSQLSPGRQVLVRLCQWLNFGQIQGVRVQDGDPILDCVPLVYVEKLLNVDEGNRPEARLKDFELRKEVRLLMVTLDEIKNGVIERIDVRRGIPCRIVYESRLPELE